MIPNQVSTETDWQAVINSKQFIGGRLYTIESAGSADALVVDIVIDRECPDNPMVRVETDDDWGVGVQLTNLPLITPDGRLYISLPYLGHAEIYPATSKQRGLTATVLASRPDMRYFCDECGACEHGVAGRIDPLRRKMFEVLPPISNNYTLCEFCLDKFRRKGLTINEQPAT